MSVDQRNPIVHEKLNTAFVNLAALLRYLQQQDFIGRVHVELEEYDADVFLDGRSTPVVQETNRAMGRKAEGDAALQRLLVRAMESGGLISVYEGEEQARLIEKVDARSIEPPPPATATPHPREGSAPVPEKAEKEPWETLDWPTLNRIAGDLVGAVERSALAMDRDFDQIFRAARLSLADDYPFLDPDVNVFNYSNTEATVETDVSPATFIGSLSECLRRVVDKISEGPAALRARERVALELAVVARRREQAVQQFNLGHYLDRIAGTKVL